MNFFSKGSASLPTALSRWEGMLEVPARSCEAAVVSPCALPPLWGPHTFAGGQIYLLLSAQAASDINESRQSFITDQVAA